MSIKKRAICMQKVSMGGKVFRCSSCGHIAVLSENDEKISKCPVCEASMDSIADDKSVKEPTSPSDV